MDKKKTIMYAMLIGSTIGGYIPTVWGDSIFSMSSVLLTAVGGFLGIWIGYKIGE